MADKTITIDVVDLTAPPFSHINIAVINQPNPVTGYSITGPELLHLIQFSKYKITETATGKPITGNNIYEYFPELNPSGGGGGGGSIDVDTSFSPDSTNPVTNALLTETLTAMTQVEYDSLETKDKPIYFVYEP